MKINIEIEDIHLKLLNAIRENWAKLGFGLDASEVMIDLLSKASVAVREEQKGLMLEQAKKLLKAEKDAQKAESSCTCKGACKQ